MKLHVIHAAELSPEHISRWSQLQRANWELASPYFCPDFTMAVALVRPNVLVALLEDAGELVGFFPFERNRWGVGRPVAGPLSDFHGVVATKDLHFDAQQLLRACGLVRWSFTHLVQEQRPFASFHCSTAESHFIDLSRGFQGYADALGQAGSGLLRDARSKTRRLERQWGTLRFVPHTADTEVLETLLRWKAAQYRLSGLADVFGFGWTTRLLRAIHATQTDGFAGMLSALYVDDELAAIHMGMRSKTAWNWWFPRHDERFAKFSPGILLRLAAAEYAPQIGIKRIDLGMGGETTYKPRLASGSIAVAQGVVEVPSILNSAHGLYRKTETWVRQSPLYVVARYPGRLVKRAESRLRFR